MQLQNFTRLGSKNINFYNEKNYFAPPPFAKEGETDLKGTCSSPSSLQVVQVTTVDDNNSGNS